MKRVLAETAHTSRSEDLVILGFFPPPYHGQAFWTDDFAASMESDWRVHRINISPPSDARFVRWKTNLDLGVARHYLKMRRRIVRELGSMPYATVIWPSISPSTLGHFRDLITVLPGFESTQRVFGVAHLGSFHRLFESPITRPSAVRLMKRLAGMIFLHDSLADRCSEWIPAHKRLVIPNTVGAAVFVPDHVARAKAKRRADADGLRVLFMSNMIEPKGYLDLLGALEILRKRSIPFRATYAGTWESADDESSFAEVVRRKGLDEVVRQVGMVTDREKVRELFVEADVFVLPTHMMEAQPLSIIESMNAATPVVVTRQGGIPWMIDDEKEGLFVELRDPKSIADAIERLSDRSIWHELALGARLRFERQFHPSVVRAQWNALLTG